MGISTDISAAEVSNSDLITEFEPFNKPSYAFTAVHGGIVGWLMRHIWVVPIFIIVVIVIVNLTAFQIIEEDSDAIAIFIFRINNIGKAFLLDGRIAYQTESTTYLVDYNTWLTASLLEDSYVYLIPLFSIFLCACILYTIFIHRAPKSFYQLVKTNRLIPQEISATTPKWVQPKSSLSYVRDLESALHSPSGKFFALFFYLLAFIMVYFFAVQRESIDIIQSGFLPLRIGEIFLIVVIPLMAGGLIGLCIWVIIVAGLYLGWLPSTFKLNIQPYHPDGCGGLKPMGDISLVMALIAIIPGVLLGLWAFRGLLGQSISAVAYLSNTMMAILGVLALVTFLVPVNRVHKEMVRQREIFQEKYLDKATARLEADKNRLRQMVALGEDESEEAQALKYHLELLEKLYPDGVIFRTWPFGYAAVVAFVVGQSLQYIPLIIGWINNYFRSFQTGGGGL